ncbi:MAG: hypothetical protein M3P18_20415, partial [Actinomycetota bacterium]|nr:hypothetical protein [Actinomycetota bacterium]
PTDGVIREALDLYKRNFGHLFVVAFVVYVGIAILSALAAAVGGIVAVLAFPLSIVGLFLVQAALVEAVADIRDGRADLSVGETLSRGASRIGPVAVAGILAGIGIFIGLVLLVIPGLILLTWWSLIVPLIVLEEVGALDSFSRSRNLVRGHDLQVFGVIVLEILLLIAVEFILALILGLLPSGIQSFVSSVVSGSVTGPFSALITTLLYFRLKAAKQGSPGGPAGPPG